MIAEENHSTQAEPPTQNTILATARELQGSAAMTFWGLRPAALYQAAGQRTVGYNVCLAGVCSLVSSLLSVLFFLFEVVVFTVLFLFWEYIIYFVISYRLTANSCLSLRRGLGLSWVAGTAKTLGTPRTRQSAFYVMRWR